MDDSHTIEDKKNKSQQVVTKQLLPILHKLGPNVKSLDLSGSVRKAASFRSVCGVLEDSFPKLEALACNQADDLLSTLSVVAVADIMSAKKLRKLREIHLNDVEIDFKRVRETCNDILEEHMNDSDNDASDDDA